MSSKVTKILFKPQFVEGNCVTVGAEFSLSQTDTSIFPDLIPPGRIHGTWEDIFLLHPEKLFSSIGIPKILELSGLSCLLFLRTY
jgi:hypothetical protein